MPRFARVCVDASIVVRLYGAVPHPMILDRWNTWLAQRVTIVAPRLLRYEVVNAFRQMHRQNELTEEAADLVLRSMLTLPIVCHDDEELHPKALALSIRFNLPASYDAHYLALSEQLGCEFWTADKRLARRVQRDLSWVHLVEFPSA